MHPAAAFDSRSTVNAQRARIGAAVRAARLRRGISVRNLARQLNMSASFVSQIENGLSGASLATLRRISVLLDISVDSLLASDSSEDTLGTLGHGGRAEPVRCAGEVAPVTSLSGDAAGGIVWRRLRVDMSRDVDVRLLRNAGSAQGGAKEPLTRHSGSEYGYVIRGSLEVVVGFETYILRSGDSVAFDAAHPHRVVSTGDLSLEAVWFVSGIAQPPRTA